MRVLVIEDDEILSEAIAERLTKSGHGVDTAADGDYANRILKHHDYDLILLDLNLPRMNGECILEALRATKSATPVLVMTARGGIDDRVQLLDLGADDYLTKPFDLRELEARCRALLRRPNNSATDELSYGNVSLDRKSCTVHIDLEEIDIKRREFRLLEIFMSHTGRVLSKEELLNHLYSFDESPSPNAIETYVARLRKKLAHSQVTIRTLRGLGYVIETS